MFVYIRGDRLNIDFHCHILPNFDDGSESVDMSLAMLAEEKAQGVDKVVLTSHFYRHHEDQAHFLRRRQQAYDELRQAVEKSGMDVPELVLGAEVAMTRQLKIEDLRPLCIEGTRTLLLELPYAKVGPWLSDVKAVIEKNTVQIVFAHIERFRDVWSKKEFEEIMELPVLKQINTSSVISDGFFRKHQLMKLIEEGRVHILGTDAHNMKSRPVNMQQAAEILTKKGCGRQLAKMMKTAEMLC